MKGLPRAHLIARNDVRGIARNCKKVRSQPLCFRCQALFIS